MGRLELQVGGAICDFRSRRGILVVQKTLPSTMACANTFLRTPALPSVCSQVLAALIHSAHGKARITMLCADARGAQDENSQAHDQDGNGENRNGIGCGAYRKHGCRLVTEVRSELGEG